MLDMLGIEIRKFLHTGLLCVTKVPEWKKFWRGRNFRTFEEICQNPPKFCPVVIEFFSNPPKIISGNFFFATSQN